MSERTVIVIGAGVLECSLFGDLSVLEHALDTIEHVAHLLLVHVDADDPWIGAQPVYLALQFSEVFAAGEDGGWNVIQGYDCSR
jgi:hypothetical protein